MRDQLRKLRQWDEQQPFTHWGAAHPWRYAALLGISVGILGVAVNWFLGAFGGSVILILSPRFWCETPPGGSSRVVRPLVVGHRG